MRHESNEDHARTKTYEEVLQPYLDSNEYEQECKEINTMYYALLDKLLEEERKDLDHLMTALNKSETRLTRQAYILGLEQGKSLMVKETDQELEC